MAKESQQPDLSDWRQKRNWLHRLWNSKKTFWIVFCLLLIPVILIDIDCILLFINFPKDISYGLTSYLSAISLTLLFLIVYDLKKPHVVLRKLKSIYFWIITVFLISLTYAHYLLVTADLLDFLVDKWLFSSGLIIAILIFLIIERPSPLFKALKSKFFWLFFTLFALIIFLLYQPVIISLTSKFWLFPFGIALVGGSLLAVWKIPLWLNESLRNVNDNQAQSNFDHEEKRLRLIDDSRKTIATIIGGLFVVIGAVFTYSNYELSYEGQVTNRFSTAVVLLKDDDSSVRLGGLYALERVAKDSPKDHSTIMEILAAYIRERSRLQEKLERGKITNANSNQLVKTIKGEQLNNNVNEANINTENSSSDMKTSEELPAPEDILTAIEIICRREQKNDKENFVFDLTKANLKRANLRNADLRNANFRNANFRNANLINANLINADLSYVDLSYVDLIYADLSYANLSYADLSYANLRNADLSYVDLGDASLTDADLSGVNLYYCKNLDFAQISQAIINGGTILPLYLKSRRAELLELSKKNLFAKEIRLQEEPP